MTNDAPAPPRQILVATDFSDGAEAAVRVAHAYAEALGARLHVLHVAWPEEIDVTGLFAHLRQALGDRVVVTVASLPGDAAEQIVRYAQLHRIDLVVVGTHGRSGFSRILLGSVAERVARTAPCPVLTVPPLAPAVREEAPIVPPAHRCIVCATVSPDLICEACRARIRGEALYAKQRDERAGRH
ncbi:MAG: universal stress protein [Candidatus Rokubacteria bacterium]|nr:universal stress protein [Candidatus Rokubacteria bacterium]